MNTKQVQTKLNNLFIKTRAEKLVQATKVSKERKTKHYDPKSHAERLRAEAMRLNMRTISGLTYKVRDNYFSNGRGTTGFNPETFEGHSYSWYALTRKIKGIVILNDYRYSSQTSIHISRVGRVMRDLGIKYQTLAAPRGLQDLDSALKHEINSMAESLVRSKYSRGNKRPDSYFVNKIKTFSNKELTLLAKLGKRASIGLRLKALHDAEAYRAAKNERLRERSAEKRAMASLEIVIDPKAKRAGETGLHIVNDRAWSWNEAGEFVGSVSDYERRNAVSKGFKTIFVHQREPRHLEVVS